MKKILVVATNWLGDALFLFPFLDNLKENLPQSELAVLSVPRIKDIFRNNLNLSEVIVYDEKGKHKGIIARLIFAFNLRKKGFDTGFILRPSLSRACILKCAGIKQIIGFDNPKTKLLLTTRVPSTDKAIHKIDYFLSMLEFLGLKINKRRYEFLPSEEDKKYIESLLLKKNIVQDLPLLVINPGANWYPKRWLSDNFAELIKRLKDNLAINIAITGAQKDKGLAGQIIKASGKEVFDFTGQTSLGQLAALMQEADIVVSADSGPMHIAAAVGKKLIALFGPTSAVITGPYPLGEHIIIQKEVGCKIPCYVKDCRDYHCMKAISVDEVFEKIEGILAIQ